MKITQIAVAIVSLSLLSALCAADGVVDGAVYSDLDCNGAQTPGGGDPGVSGVCVKIVSACGRVVRSTTTDANGHYQFLAVPDGNYTVRLCSAPPGCTIPTEHVDGAVAVTVNSTDVHGVHFGFAPCRTVDGTVYSDLNANNARDPGDTGLSGVCVSLISACGVVQSTTTDATGSYHFVGLSCTGAFTVRLCSAPPGCVTATEHGAGSVPVNVGSADVHEVNFGFALCHAVDGFVYSDRNVNSTKDTGDTGIGQFCVSLVSACGDELLQTTTDANGFYQFGAMPNGDYTVRLCSAPPQCTFATEHAAGSVPVTVNFTDVHDVNFGFAPCSSAVSGYAYSDLNANSAKDTGDAGLGGVCVKLVVASSGAAVPTTTTDAAGLYRFDQLPCGNYSVELCSAPPACTFATEHRDGPVPAIVGCADVNDVNFGFAPCSSAVSGYVYSDLNANSAKGTDDVGLSGVCVKLVSSSGGVMLQNTTTDAAGLFRFDQLPCGNYSVELCSAPPGTCRFPTEHRDGTVPVTVVCADVTGVSFGFAPCLRSVSGCVYLDVAANSTKDSGDPGIAGTTVRLRCTGDHGENISMTTTTDASGNFQFTGIPDGLVCCATVVDPPAGSSPTEAPVPPCFNVTRNISGVCFGFTLVCPPAGCPSNGRSVGYWRQQLCAFSGDTPGRQQLTDQQLTNAIAAVEALLLPNPFQLVGTTAKEKAHDACTIIANSGGPAIGKLKRMLLGLEFNHVFGLGYQPPYTVLQLALIAKCEEAVLHSDQYSAAYLQDLANQCEAINAQ